MNNSLTDLIQTQQELNERLTPIGFEAIFETNKMFDPVLSVVPDNRLQAAVDKPYNALDMLTATVRDVTDTNSAIHAAFENQYKKSALGNALTTILDQGSLSAALSKSWDTSSLSLYQALGLQNSVNLKYASEYIAPRNILGLSGLGDIMKLRSVDMLQEPNTSFLNTSFEFIEQAFHSFTLPDFEEIEIGSNKEEKKKIIIQICPSEIGKVIRQLYKDPSRLNDINPRKFEETIAELFRFHGYHVTLTKQTRDGGFDMSLERIMPDGTLFKAVAECKRINGKKVDVNVIRCLSAVAYREYAQGNLLKPQGIIVTSSTFSPDAIKETTYMPAKLSLKDRNDIIDWAGSYSGKLRCIDLDLSKRTTQQGIIY